MVEVSGTSGSLTKISYSLQWLGSLKLLDWFQKVSSPGTEIERRWRRQSV